MSIFRIALGILLAGSLFLAGSASAAGKTTPAEVKRWQQDKVTFYLVDVRSAYAFNRKHIDGALNIPAFVVARKGLPKGETIVLYDGGVGGTEAAAAAAKLEDAGYSRVTVIEGGLAAWEIAGLPVGAPRGVLGTPLVEAITCEDLARASADGREIILVDLRKPAYFKEGSIPGARNIQPDALLDGAASWSKSALVVLFDGGSVDPARQAELLRRAGFKMVRFLYGGYPAWTQQKVPQL